MTALLVVFVTPSVGRAQSEDVTAVAHLAALDFFRDLGPAAVLRDYYCDNSWREAYDLPVRCMDPPFYTSLRLVSERLRVPLVEEWPDCPDGGPDLRSLQLSPVQLDAADSAWFVTMIGCASGEGARRRLHLVELERVDAGWRLLRTTALRASEHE
jgi:hypothetical protein